MDNTTYVNKSTADEGTVLLIDKPLEWTSFDVVKKVRALFNVRKVGHTGTLDPKATGLLIVCTGKKTKNIGQYVGLEKEYTGTLKLGVRTASLDTETAVIETKDYSAVTDSQIQSAAAGFLGKSHQLPPMYSAVKYHGKPLYRYAREGKIIDREEREITIKAFDITAIHKPDVEFRVICSRGTYVRTLIDEMGRLLGCGAVLSELRRVRIGENHLENALTMEQLARWRDEVYCKRSSRQ